MIFPVVCHKGFKLLMHSILIVLILAQLASILLRMSLGLLPQGKKTKIFFLLFYRTVIKYIFSLVSESGSLNIKFESYPKSPTRLHYNDYLIIHSKQKHIHY